MWHNTAHNTESPLVIRDRYMFSETTIRTKACCVCVCVCVCLYSARNRKFNLSVKFQKAIDTSSKSSSAIYTTIFTRVWLQRCEKINYIINELRNYTIGHATLRTSSPVTWWRCLVTWRVHIYMRMLSRPIVTRMSIISRWIESFIFVWSLFEARAER